MKLLKDIKAYVRDKPMTKRVVGVILILIGFLALVTPLTPGSWLALIGFQLFGVRILFFDKLYSRLLKKNIISLREGRVLGASIVVLSVLFLVYAFIIR